MTFIVIDASGEHGVANCLEKSGQNNKMWIEFYKERFCSDYKQKNGKFPLPSFSPIDCRNSLMSIALVCALMHSWWLCRNFSSAIALVWSGSSVKTVSFFALKLCFFVSGFLELEMSESGFLPAVCHFPGALEILFILLASCGIREATAFIEFDKSPRGVRLLTSDAIRAVNEFKEIFCKSIGTG